MAYKSFRHLTPRNQSSLVTQLHKLISYYGEIFCPRERVYLKSLSQHDNVIYWLEDEDKKLVAVAILDPNYVFEANGIKLHTLSYLISKRQGQMDRILAHVWSDWSDKSLLLLSRQALTAGINMVDLQLAPLTTGEAMSIWPELLHQPTDFFNISRETLAQGLDRKQYNLYLKLTEQDKEILRQTKPELLHIVENREPVTA